MKARLWRWSSRKKSEGARAGRPFGGVRGSRKCSYPPIRNWSGQNVAAGFFSSDSADEAGFDERAEEVERSLFRDANSIPDLARGKGFLLAEKMKELFLF